jgi:hypothetical protein
VYVLVDNVKKLLVRIPEVVSDVFIFCDYFVLLLWKITLL